jgi:hypothetical protein
MSHFLDPCHTPELAYHIETRETKRLVNEEEHTIYRVLDRLLVVDARGTLGHGSTGIFHF